MSDTVIAVENLSKRYLIGQAEQRHETLAGSLASALMAPLRNARKLARLDASRVACDSPDILWALREVSFEVKRGEVIGIIGRNGAGKSTLLKILSQITEPTSGWVGIKGRVASLLEVGTGFHPELTGRDNVYMNGTLLGMTKKEIDQKFDEIVDFSGVEKFLDTPVKRYSSGMQVRLAFAVAAHLDPEILVVDEVLAVGDAEFQKKCLGKMKEVASGSEGRTVLFVSHNMTAVRNLCSRTLLLERGSCSLDGDTGDVVDAYLERTDSIPSGGYSRSSNDERPGIIAAEVFGETDEVASLPADKSLRFEIRCVVPCSRQPAELGIGIDSIEGNRVVTLHSSAVDRPKLADGDHVLFCCQIPALNLYPGRYSVKLSLESPQGVLEVLDPAFRFDVTDGSGGGRSLAGRRGMLAVPQRWSTAVS